MSRVVYVSLYVLHASLIVAVTTFHTDCIAGQFIGKDAKSAINEVMVVVGRCQSNLQCVCDGDNGTCTVDIQIDQRFMVFISCEIDKTYNMYLPDVFSARSACGTATCGAGRSKNTASAFPFSDSSKPSSQTSRW